MRYLAEANKSGNFCDRYAIFLLLRSALPDSRLALCRNLPRRSAKFLLNASIALEVLEN
jgi:hypothetical protein